MNSVLLNSARAISGWIVDIRRTLHQHPEVKYEEVETSRLVQKTLTELGISFRHSVARTGVVATLGTGSGPCVALRADMDALPIHEEADVEFPSRIPGKMHACGHDCHTAMLLGAARLLKERESELRGTVRLIFQPAEEGGAGGARMIEEGALQNPGVDRVFGIHVWPELPTGFIGGRTGTLMAAVGSLRISVRGKGGHAAFPHMTHDPVVAMSQIICGLQTVVAREMSPFDPSVVSITTLCAGNAFNVIPQDVVATGTIRSLTTEGLLRLRAAIERIAVSIASAHRCTATVERIDDDPDYPATVNDANSWAMVQKAAADLVPLSQIVEVPPVLGGEDFAYYAEKVPGCFVGLGIRNEAIGAVEFVHHPRFKVDEAALPVGAALHTSFALHALKS
ncbi:MAG: amidohydrolase [Planctomyces sp.]|nr:amidohydrolase [Planctomyces sp.]